MIFAALFSPTRFQGRSNATTARYTSCCRIARRISDRLCQSRGLTECMAASDLMVRSPGHRSFPILLVDYIFSFSLSSLLGFLFLRRKMFLRKIAFLQLLVASSFLLLHAPSAAATIKGKKGKENGYSRGRKGRSKRMLQIFQNLDKKNAAATDLLGKLD